MSTARKFTLKSGDGVSSDVDEAVAMQSQTIMHMISDNDNGGAGHGNDDIQLPHVTSSVLAKVIDYCNKHVTEEEDEDEEEEEEDELSPNASDDDVVEEDVETSSWDSEFVKVDEDTLWDLLLAANYLEIEGLRDLTYRAVVDMVEGRTEPEIKEVMNMGQFLGRYKRNPWACI